MNELIRIEKQSVGGNEINSVDARELHSFLESRQDFTDWIKGRIEGYDFDEGQDFSINLGKTSNGGRPRTDYTISIDMAKELCMVEKNEKGKEARKYFIECEKKLKESNPLEILNDPQAMRCLLLTYSEKVIALQSTIEEQRPKVEFAKTIEGTDGLINFGDFAKLGGNIGRNTLFKILRERKILMNGNIPYQTYINEGYFKTREYVVKRTNGDVLKQQTLITGKGQTWISKNFDQWSGAQR